MTRVIICQFEDLDISVLRPEDAPRLEGLKQGYTSYMGEWIYRGTAEDFIAESLERFTNDDGFWAGVWWRDQLAGAVGLNAVNHWIRSAKIDYMLGTAFRGQGIMTKAVKAMVDHCFHELNLNRIEIRVDLLNVKSGAIPERLGFRREALMRQNIFYGQEFGDLVVYAVLANEWQK